MQQPSLQKLLCVWVLFCLLFPPPPKSIADKVFWMNSIFWCQQVFWPSLLLHYCVWVVLRTLLLLNDVNVHGRLLVMGTGRQNLSGLCAVAILLVSFPQWTFIEMAVLGFFWSLWRDFSLSNFKVKYIKFHMPTACVSSEEFQSPCDYHNYTK